MGFNKNDPHYKCTLCEYFSACQKVYGGLTENCKAFVEKKDKPKSIKQYSKVAGLKRSWGI